jgi:hypothetical protein
MNIGHRNDNERKNLTAAHFSPDLKNLSKQKKARLMEAVRNYSGFVPDDTVHSDGCFLLEGRLYAWKLNGEGISIGPASPEVPWYVGVVI